MSYILDALRRAEADRERERGQVPGLHTQPLSGKEDAPAAGRRRWLPWAGGGLLLLAGIGAGSWWASGPQEAAAPVSQPAPTARVTTASPTEAAPPPVASAQVPQPAASGSPYLPPAPPPSVVPMLPAPAPRSEGVAAPAPAPVAAAVPAPMPAPAPAPVPASAAEARIPRLSELPEGVRRELPRLAISGSVYSDDPASRFVIVNGDVVREGARLGADLELEQIRPRELVLRFKGQRFRQPI